MAGDPQHVAPSGTHRRPPPPSTHLFPRKRAHPSRSDKTDSSGAWKWKLGGRTRPAGTNGERSCRSLAGTSRVRPLRSPPPSSPRSKSGTARLQDGSSCEEEGSFSHHVWLGLSPFSASIGRCATGPPSPPADDEAGSSAASILAASSLASLRSRATASARSSMSRSNSESSSDCCHTRSSAKSSWKTRVSTKAAGRARQKRVGSERVALS